MARESKTRVAYVHSSSQVCRGLHAYIHTYYTYKYVYIYILRMYVPVLRMCMHVYTYYSCMYQFREWVGRHMKCTTGRKVVMHSGMKQTCLPHSNNT